jgi:hypothetical protein
VIRRNIHLHYRYERAEALQTGLDLGQSDRLIIGLRLRLVGTTAVYLRMRGYVTDAPVDSAACWELAE